MYVYRHIHMCVLFWKWNLTQKLLACIIYSLSVGQHVIWLQESDTNPHKSHWHYFTWLLIVNHHASVWLINVFLAELYGTEEKALSGFGYTSYTCWALGNAQFIDSYGLLMGFVDNKKNIDYHHHTPNPWSFQTLVIPHRNNGLWDQTKHNSFSLKPNQNPKKSVLEELMSFCWALEICLFFVFWI